MASCGKVVLRSLSLSFWLLSQAVGGSGYPIAGKVVAVHLTEQNRYIPGYDNGAGAKSSGVSVKDRHQVYRIEVPDRFLDLEGNRHQVFKLGQDIALRIEKDTAHILIDGKDRKFRIIGQELKGGPDGKGSDKQT